MKTAYAEVTEAARAYERRWTLRTLLAVDPGLYERFREQQRLWEAALVTGELHELRQQTDAMVRGWQVITRRLEDAGTEDDCYLLGVCARTGTKVAIGEQLAAREQVQELHGEAVVWMTPHECAALLASHQTVAGLKRLFPGAELLDLVPNEPGKGDA